MLRPLTYPHRVGLLLLPFSSTRSRAVLPLPTTVDTNAPPLTQSLVGRFPISQLSGKT